MDSRIRCWCVPLALSLIVPGVEAARGHGTAEQPAVRNVAEMTFAPVPSGSTGHRRLDGGQ